MPTGASVQHVKDHMLVDEQQVTLDLLVEGVSNLHTAHVVRTRLGPHPAHLAGVTDLRNQVEDRVRDSNSFEEAAHHHRGGVPPANMQLPEREPVRTYSTCPEEPDNSANVEVRPIGRILWVLAGATPCAPVPGY